MTFLQNFLYNTSFKIHKGTLNVSPVTVESNIPVELVEHEFWRLIDHVGTHINEDVNVEYGADIEVVKNGSGMPHYRFNNNHAKKEECKDYEFYANHCWNICNLATHDQSIFKRLDGDISGVKVPWTYSGMCFSAFAWHTEDHWAPAINYHHWGESKIWYAAPQADAQKMENIMASYAPDLYNSNLVHDVTTTFSPYTGCFRKKMSRKGPKTAKKGKNDQNSPFLTQNDLKLHLLTQKRPKIACFYPETTSNDRFLPQNTTF